MIKTYSYKKDKDIFLTKHFQVGEFRSYNEATRTLTSDTILIDENLPVLLEKLYEYLDNKFGIKSIVITSGYRTEDFELSLSGGVKNGQHTKGKAADFIVNKKDGGVVSAKEVCCACEEIGFNGIGYGNNYTHADTRDSKSYFDETNGRTGISSFYSYFNIEKPNINNNYQVGDKVEINGIYVSSAATEKLTPRITSGTITKIINNARNPYLLDDGNLGWVNDSVIISKSNSIYLSNTSYTGVSIVDALNEINVDSSFNYRTKLANANGISNYTGSATQNSKLLNLLKQGKLIKA